MLKRGKYLLLLPLCFILIFMSMPAVNINAASDNIPYIVLSHYYTIADIGDSFYLIAYTSTGKKPTFKSSDSKIASVNTYGLVTAKKAGTVTITAKIKDAEASCRISVNKTNITLNDTNISIEHGEQHHLKAYTSNGSSVKWKSNRKSIATIDENGCVTGNKPGDAIITASADGTNVTCFVRVRQPVVTLSNSSLSLYRREKVSLGITVSSGLAPKWKSSRSSIATVDQTGCVTAVKNGVTKITATVDGVSKSCMVTVKKPNITLSSTELQLNVGSIKKIAAKVSSGNTPTWTSSNPNVATVSQTGAVKGIKKGTATITATEDGTKVKCKIYVVEK